MRSILLLGSLFLAACSFDASGVEAPADDDSTVEVDAGPDDPTVSSPDAGVPDATEPEPDARDSSGPGGDDGPGHHGD
jgi:hypothetical protein